LLPAVANGATFRRKIWSGEVWQRIAQLEEVDPGAVIDTAIGLESGDGIGALGADQCLVYLISQAEVLYTIGSIISSISLFRRGRKRPQPVNER
jgi:hypothetical protein